MTHGFVGICPYCRRPLDRGPVAFYCVPCEKNWPMRPPDKNYHHASPDPRPKADR